MANTSRPSGLSPVARFDGAPWNGRLNLYYIPSTDNNAFAIGDPVASAGSADANGVPSVTLATAGAGNAVRGVIVTAGGTSNPGFYADPNNLGTIVIPATKTQGYYVGVCDDPDVIFEAQEDSVGGALAATNVGQNIDLVSGANNGFVSGWQLDSSSAATGATLQCKLLRLAPRLDNAIGTYAKWWVLINNHELKAGVAGV